MTEKHTDILRRSLANMLAVLLITSAVISGAAIFGVTQSGAVSAASLQSDIKAGDTIELQSGDWEEEYIVLDPDNTNTGEDGMLLLQKECSNSRTTVFDESGLENKWEDSIAQKWCIKYYSSLPVDIRRSIIGVRTTESESGYSNAGINNIDGTRCGGEAAKDKVFFLSSMEYLTYSDRVKLVSPCKWWLRSPGVDCSEYHDYACVVMENGRILPFGVGYIEQGEEYLGHAARPAFNIDIPDNAVAAKTTESGEEKWQISIEARELPSDAVQNGEHLFAGKSDHKGYKGLPYWRILDRDESGNLFLMSEYLWTGDGIDSAQQIQFNGNTSKGTAWDGSDAQKWCRSFESDVLNGTEGLSVSGGVTFLSEEEAVSYMQNPQDRITSFPEGVSSDAGRNWWLRTAKDDSSLVRIVTGVYGIISQSNINSSYPARPAFWANIPKDAVFTKNEQGDWIVEPGGSSHEDGGSDKEEYPELDPADRVPASQISEGDHLYAGEKDGGDFNGLPYWRVLEKNEDGKLLLMSEYLWRTDDSKTNGLFCFNADRSKLNNWQGSDARAWCENFETDVLGEAEGLSAAMTTKSDAGYVSPDNPAISFLETENILEDDKVFFLSAEETVHYMPEKTDRIAYIPDGSRTRAESWWLRSGRAEAGGTHCVGRVFSYGSLEKNFADYLGAGRPAFWAELSDDAMAYKSGDDYLILKDGEDPRAELAAVKKRIDELNGSGDSEPEQSENEKQEAEDSKGDNGKSNADRAEADQKTSPEASAEESPSGQAAEAGGAIAINGSKYIIVSKGSRTAALVKAKNTRRFTVPAAVRINGRKYKVVRINAKAFKGTKVKNVTVGKNVKKIRKGAFAGSTVKTVILRTKLLRKSGIRGCLKGSKVKTVKIKVGSKSRNKKILKAYRKIFKKSVTGKKVRLK